MTAFSRFGIYPGQGDERLLMNTALPFASSVGFSSSSGSTRRSATRGSCLPVEVRGGGTSGAEILGSVAEDDKKGASYIAHPGRPDRGERRAATDPRPVARA